MRYFYLIILFVLPTITFSQSKTIERATTIYQWNKNGKVIKKYKGKTLTEKEQEGKLKKDKELAATIKAKGNPKKVTSKDVVLYKYFSGDFVYINGILQSTEPDSIIIYDENGRQRLKNVYGVGPQYPEKVKKLKEEKKTMEVRAVK